MRLLGRTICSACPRPVAEMGWEPLARFASECGVGVLVICHARKRSSHDSTHGVQATVLGSVDYVASCRSAVLVQKDPKAEAGTAGIMTHAKCNFGPLGPSLSFSIGTDGWRWGEERQESADEIEEALLARREHKKNEGPGGVAGVQESPDKNPDRRENPDLPGGEPGRRVLDPGTEGDRRGPVRHHRRRLEPDVGGRATWYGAGRADRRCCGASPITGSGGKQEDEDKPPETASRSGTASQNPGTKREAVSCWKFNGLPCGKPTASRFSPSMRARGKRFGKRFARWNEKRAEKGEREAPSKTQWEKPVTGAGRTPAGRHPSDEISILRGGRNNVKAPSFYRQAVIWAGLLLFCPVLVLGAGHQSLDRRRGSP